MLNAVKLEVVACVKSCEECTENCKELLQEPGLCCKDLLQESEEFCKELIQEFKELLQESGDTCVHENEDYQSNESRVDDVGLPEGDEGVGAALGVQRAPCAHESVCGDVQHVVVHAGARRSHVAAAERGVVFNEFTILQVPEERDTQTTQQVLPRRASV